MLRNPLQAARRATNRRQGCLNRTRAVSSAYRITSPGVPHGRRLDLARKSPSIVFCETDVTCRKHSPAGGWDRLSTKLPYGEVSTQYVVTFCSGSAGARALSVKGGRPLQSGV
eukprot:1193996-Prorocentrum_minimum.AAC.6